MKRLKLRLLEVDNTAVRDAQINRLKQLKQERNQNEVDLALKSLTNCAKTGEGNLLELSVNAARKRATLGEISSALEEEFSRHVSRSGAVSGVYAKELKNSKEVMTIKEIIEKFEKIDGRRPRILVAKLGQDGHDRGARVIATSFADLGFDVDIGPLFQTPDEVAMQAAENDVHIIGASSLAAGHKTLIPELISELKKIDRGDIMVIVGGVIPPKDYEFLQSKGVAGIFGPGTKITDAAKEILEQLLTKMQ